jgi:hypothetical protein
MRLLSVFVAVAMCAVSVAAQSPEIRPTWKDRETWSRFDAAANETEIGLGLQPNSLALAFTARFPGKSPTPPASEVIVKVAMGPNFNATVIRAVTFRVILDEGQPKLAVIDLSSRFVGNELMPTTNLRSGIARLTPAEYQRITRARGVRVDVLGAEVPLSKVQLDAMRAFGKKVVPVPAK